MREDETFRGSSVKHGQSELVPAFYEMCGLYMVGRSRLNLWTIDVGEGGKPRKTGNGKKEHSDSRIRSIAVEETDSFFSLPSPARGYHLMHSLPFVFVLWNTGWANSQFRVIRLSKIRYVAYYRFYIDLIYAWYPLICLIDCWSTSTHAF